MWVLYPIGIVLMVLGVLGYGGRGKLDLGDFGKYTGPALVFAGIACLILGAITGAAGL